MRHAALGVAFGTAAVLGLSQGVFAHFTLLQPPSALSTENGGKGAPPCGEGTPSNVVTKIQGGHPYTIKLIETINHPGHYRIALAADRSQLPTDPVVAEDENHRSVSAPVEPAPKMPVLADGLFMHTIEPRNTPREAEVMVPNMNCPRCTLQVIQFMAQHALNVGGGFYYHHCADVEISADRAAGPVVPATGAATLAAWR